MGDPEPVTGATPLKEALVRARAGRCGNRSAPPRRGVDPVLNQSLREGRQAG